MMTQTVHDVIKAEFEQIQVYLENVEHLPSVRILAIFLNNPESKGGRPPENPASAAADRKLVERRVALVSLRSDVPLSVRLDCVRNNGTSGEFVGGLAGAAPQTPWDFGGMARTFDAAVKGAIPETPRIPGVPSISATGQRSRCIRRVVSSSQPRDQNAPSDLRSKTKCTAARGFSR